MAIRFDIPDAQILEKQNWRQTILKPRGDVARPL